jgi:hypothetical protein
MIQAIIQDNQLYYLYLISETLEEIVIHGLFGFLNRLIQNFEPTKFADKSQVEKCRSSRMSTLNLNKTIVGIFLDSLLNKSLNSIWIDELKFGII